MLDLVVVGLDLDRAAAARDPDLRPLDLLAAVAVVAVRLDPGIDLDLRPVPRRDRDRSLVGLDPQTPVLLERERPVNFLDVRGLCGRGSQQEQSRETGGLTKGHHREPPPASRYAARVRKFPGFAFRLPRVAEVTEGSRGSQSVRERTGGVTADGGEQEAHRGSLEHGPRRVPPQHMLELMGEDARELLGAMGPLEETSEDHDVTAGNGDGVDE